MQRYPALVDGAFVIIAWVGLKLGLEYLHAAWHIGVEIPQLWSIGLIVVIFTIALIYARLQGPVDTADPLTDKAEALIATEEQPKS